MNSKTEIDGLPDVGRLYLFVRLDGTLCERPPQLMTNHCMDLKMNFVTSLTFLTRIGTFLSVVLDVLVC